MPRKKFHELPEEEQNKRFQKALDELRNDPKLQAFAKKMTKKWTSGHYKAPKDI